MNRPPTIYATPRKHRYISVRHYVMSNRDARRRLRLSYRSLLLHNVPPELARGAIWDGLFIAETWPPEWVGDQ